MNTRRRQRDGFGGASDGAAAAELALILPMLALILFGTIEFGRMFHNYNVIAKGVRDAGRYLARVPADPCSGGTWAPVSGTAVAEAQNLATRGVITGGTLNLANFANGTVAFAQPCVANSNGLTGIYGAGGDIKLVTVTATVPHTFILGDYVIPGLPTLNFTVQHQQPHVGE